MSGVLSVSEFMFGDRGTLEKARAVIEAWAEEIESWRTS